MTPSQNLAFDTSDRVMVTGATGYLAGWLIKRLIEAGVTVHAATRSSGDSSRVAHLEAMAAQGPGKIHYFSADLLTPASHAPAMRDCAVVFHVASPFILSGPDTDPLRDFVEPALLGTRHVLETANRTPSVQRVVLTSSCAAICGGQDDLAKAPNHILDESMWNTMSTIDNNPYNYSKTVAERAAWQIAEAQDRWRLVVVNPAFVLGPGAAPRQTSASFDFIKALGDGTYLNGAPPFCIGTVDVQDVVEAHLRAAWLPDASGRYIVSAEVHTLGELAEILRAHFGSEWPFPRDSGLPRGTIRWRADNARSHEQLAVEYHPVANAVIAMYAQMIETGLVRPPVPTPRSSPS